MTSTDVSPTSTGDRYVRIEGRLGDDENSHAEWAAVGFIPEAFGFQAPHSHARLARVVDRLMLPDWRMPGKNGEEFRGE